MKQYQKALILASLALAFFSALLVVLLADTDKPAVQPARAYEITSLSVTEISAVAINNNTGAYGFMLGQDGFISMVPELETGEEDYSQEEMRAFIFLLSKLTATQTIEGGAAPAEFGLEQPLARIALILKDSSTLRFRLGQKSPVDESYYFQKEGDPRVFLIGKTTADLMQRTRSDYWNKELLPGLSTESLELLRSIRLSSAEHESRNWQIEHLEDFTFQLSQPVSIAIKTDNAFSMLILPLSTLRPQRFVGLSGDLAPYGLDRPEYTLTVMHGDTAHELLFSHDGKDGFYTTRRGRPGIFSIPEDRLDFLATAYRQLLGDYLYNGSMASVESIEFSRPSKATTYRLELFGEGAQMYGIIAGRSIAYQQVTAAMTPLFQIGIVGETSRDEKSREDMRKAQDRVATSTVIIRKRNGTTDTLEFLAMNDVLSYVRLNGQVSFTAYTHAAQAIEDALAAL